MGENQVYGVMQTKVRVSQERSTNNVKYPFQGQGRQD